MTREYTKAFKGVYSLAKSLRTVSANYLQLFDQYVQKTHDQLSTSAKTECAIYTSVYFEFVSFL